MSYVAKTYEFLGKLEKLFNKKMFKTAFIAISSMFLFFGVMNVYAVDDTVQVTPDWSGTKTFYNEASGLTGEDVTEDNMTSHSGQLGLNTAWIVFSTLIPEYTQGGQALLNDPRVPADMKIGLVGMSDKALAFVYENQPSVDVIAHLQEEWVPGYKESSTGLYAAGDTSGYDSLMGSGIAGIWNQFRNIAYIAFVVVMIVIGFMIMFRSKLGGQTLVSLGNTIPSIIVSLILVTFSFAIAGIIIDMGGVLISLLYHMIYNNESVSIANFGKIFSILFKGLGTQAGEAINLELGDSFSMLTNFSSITIKGLIELYKDVMGTLWMGIAAIIGIIIGSGVVLVGAIKLLIVLYKAYFEILLNVILGPVKILMGTFPGQENMKINWFTGLIRNVLVFPIAYFIINLPIFLMSAGNVVLSLPDKLTGASLDTTAGDAWTLSTTTGYWGLIITFIFRIFVIYYACQAPKFAEAIIPVKETNRAAADAMAGAKMGMSKLPLIGGLFSGK